MYSIDISIFIKYVIIGLTVVLKYLVIFPREQSIITDDCSAGIFLMTHVMKCTFMLRKQVANLSHFFVDESVTCFKF